ncbi:antitoxin HicB [Corynebacterium sp. CNJ-954]|uniref:antitoxin HicB n=1 Tax=Corynebacterium sp. CNJ-954 TaxID=1904962 RepID=UPI00095FA964|nr:antitoxin HicB [Corynebacterium sp. CNJ-954]OLT54428.1 antitoxin HicB [Corynebacterium sp. CNJ-954]
MDTSAPLTVTARRWSGGWELILDEDNATSVRTLARATEQVRDYLDTVAPEVDHSGVSITIVPDIGHLAEQITLTREQTAAAAQAQATAAAQSRQVAQALRQEGLSLADSAVLLGVSKGRVAQLLDDAAG